MSATEIPQIPAEVGKCESCGHQLYQNSPVVIRAVDPLRIVHVACQTFEERSRFRMRANL